MKSQDEAIIATGEIPKEELLILEVLADIVVTDILSKQNNIPDEIEFGQQKSHHLQENLHRRAEQF